MQKTKTLHLQTGCCNIQYFISVFVDKCLINLWFLPFYYMDNAERYFPVALLWMCGYLMPAPGVRKCYLKSLSFFSEEDSPNIYYICTPCLLALCFIALHRYCISYKLKACAKSLSAIFLKAFAHVMSLNYQVFEIILELFQAFSLLYVLWWPVIRVTFCVTTTTRWKLGWWLAFFSNIVFWVVLFCVCAVQYFSLCTSGCTGSSLLCLGFHWLWCWDSLRWLLLLQSAGLAQ